MSGILESICKAQEAYMTDLRLPSDMAELRPALGGIVAQAREQAPYFTVLLSSKQGLTIQIDNREEHVVERTPSAGTVLSAFDGRTIFERAVSGFHKDEVQKAARELVREADFASYGPVDEPQRSGERHPVHVAGRARRRGRRRSSPRGSRPLARDRRRWLPEIDSLRAGENALTGARQRKLANDRIERAIAERGVMNLDAVRGRDERALGIFGKCWGDENSGDQSRGDECRAHAGLLRVKATELTPNHFCRG